MTKAVAAEVIVRCFEARTCAHLAHLKTKSYSAHVALQEFYEAVLDKADAFAECYQGVFGRITDYPTYACSSGEITPIKELREWLAENRSNAARGQRELENLLDEITAICDRALYKLANLS
jgi:hypothetical protein